MTVVVIEPPSELVVSVEEAKAHLRVDFDDDDDLIEGYLQAAIGNFDGPGGWLGRALILQTLELRLDRFPFYGVVLPYAPVVDLQAVLYDDDDGVEQTLDPAVTRIVGGDHHSRLVRAYGQSWPSTRCQEEAVRIQYRAGYGESGADVPAPIRQAILLYVGHFYANREQVVIGGQPASLPLGVEALLAPFRIFA